MALSVAGHISTIVLVVLAHPCVLYVESIRQQHVCARYLRRYGKLRLGDTWSLLSRTLCSVCVDYRLPAMANNIPNRWHGCHWRTHTHGSIPETGRSGLAHCTAKYATRDSHGNGWVSHVVADFFWSTIRIYLIYLHLNMAKAVLTLGINWRHL